MTKRPMLVIACALALSGCDWMKPRQPLAAETSAEAARANARKLKRACGSQATYDRLKALLFEEAARVRKGDSPVLDKLAEVAVVRMESPVARSRDNELNVTVCTGKFVLELPPGAEDAFDGDRRLEADVEYAAQAAADASGLVYQMQGAEPIIYRLAALDLQRRGSRSAIPAPVEQRPFPEVLAETAIDAPLGQEEADVDERPEPPRIVPPPVVSPPPRDDLPQATRRERAARPSFNCRYARSRVEKMICADDALAARDRQMSAVFYDALAGADGRTRAALRSSRDRFLGYRDRCPDADCVGQAYADRIREIGDIAQLE